MISQSLQKVIYNEENARSIWSIFQQNKKKHQKEIAQRFKKLRDMIKRAEDSANKKLDELSLVA